MLAETAEKIIMAVAQNDGAKAKVTELLRQFGLAAIHDSKVQDELWNADHGPSCRCEECRFWS